MNTFYCIHCERQLTKIRYNCSEKNGVELRKFSNNSLERIEQIEDLGKSNNMYRCYFCGKETYAWKYLDDMEDHKKAIERKKIRGMFDDAKVNMRMVDNGGR